MKFLIVCALVAAPFLCSAGEPPPISQAEVDRRLNGRCELIPSLSAEVKLIDKKSAWLLSCQRPEASRAEGHANIMYVPETDRLTEFGSNLVYRTVLDLEGDGVSEVELTHGGVGQGIMAGRYHLGRFGGKKNPHVFFTSADFEDNSGAYDAGSPEHEVTDVELFYIDLNDDGIDDIIQRVTHTKGSERLSRWVKRWLFDGKKLTRH